MKKFVVAIMVLSMMMSAIAAMAQTEKNFSITPRIVADFAMDGDTKDYVGSQYGLLVDLDWASFPIGFETGWLGGQKSGNDVTLSNGGDISINIDQKVDTWSVPLLLTYKYPFSSQFYADLALGANIQHDKIRWEYTVDSKKYDEDYSKTKTKFAWKIGLGYKFTPNWSVELNYANNGKIKHDLDFASGIPTTLGIDEIEYKQNYLQLNVGYSF